MEQIQHQIILAKLDEFIRKFYKNQLIRGALYASGLSLLFFLSAVFFEYIGEFGSAIRMLLFFTWLISTFSVVVWFVIVPISKLYRLGKIISHDQAAQIIGKYFSSVQDKLLNYLQLSRQSDEIAASALLQAAIHQRIQELNPVPFSSAIKFSENKKHLKWVLIPLTFLLFLLFSAPSILSESTRRLIHYESHFEKPAPFRFELLNKNLCAIQQGDFTIDLKISGIELPAEVFIESETGVIRLEKEKNNIFHYTFKNLQANLKFYFSANGFTSAEYELKVLSKPTLTDFSIQLDYPNYTGKKDEVVKNIGDLLIPQGTKVLWSFNTKNSNSIFLGFSDTLLNLSPRTENNFSFSKTFLRSGNYFIHPVNDQVKFGDSIAYVVNVIPDAYPFIEMNQQQDSVHPKNIYFSGSIKDDYGFSALRFNYLHYSVDSFGLENKNQQSVALHLAPGQTLQPFYHSFNLNTLTLKPGDRVEYFFEIIDNDAVNGGKSSRTKAMIFNVPTLDELNKESSKKNSTIEKNMEEALKEAKALQNQISDIARKLQEKKQMNWEDKKKLEELMNHQQELKNKIENFKNQNNLNNEIRNEFSPPSQEMLNKQQELEKLMENIMTPELQKLFDELQKLMEKMTDKQKIQETLDKLKLSDKDMEKELDRNLELFKQMDVEQRLDNAIKKLDELQKQQDELSMKTNPDKKSEEKLLNEKKDQIKNQLDELRRQEEKLKNSGVENKEQQQALTEKSNELKKQLEDIKRKIDANKNPQQSSEELKKEQETITEKFNDLKNELKELDKKNRELENPNKLPDMNQLQQQISNDQKNSEQQLNQNDKKGSSKSQKGAADKMQDMQNMMEMVQQQMSQEQEGEDIAAIRQLLENLLHLSFEQEDLMSKTKKAKSTDPNFTQLGQAQHNLKEEVKKVEDTLLAISKRQPKISSEVNREINSIQMNMGKTISALEERVVFDASTRQQNIMTSINNLALMLNESLEQLQQQAAQKKGGSPGGGSCKNPGGSGQKPSMGNMRKMQEALNKQLQDMKNAMEKGGQKPGQKKGQGGAGGISSEQFAKAAAQQEALRRLYQDAMKNLKDGGKNPGGNLANMMEETENELVNKMISQQTLFRQQEILTRLLESEKAEQEREMDEKRESNESKDKQISNQNSFLEYKRLKEKELELLKTVPPNLNPYYKEKVNDYFNNYTK